MKNVLIAGMFATLLGSASASAQEVGLSDGWYKVCSKSGETEICNVQISTVASTGFVIASLNLAEITNKDGKKRYFQLTVPTSRMIPPGLKIKIDDQKAEPVPYSFCTPRHCIAQRKLTDAIVTNMKSGSKIELTSTNWQGKENPVYVTLDGFGDAFDGKPLTAAQLEARKTSLEKKLKDKSSNTLDKLKEAQKKAREEN